MKKKYNDNQDIIENIASKFRDRKFLYLTEDDIKQEVRKICYEALSSFDGKRGASLTTYLTRCVTNRLNNLKRDYYFRFENPCKKNRCPAYDIFSKSCIFPKSYQDICIEKKISDEKMQRQIMTSSYVSIDSIDEDSGIKAEHGEGNSIIKEEMREAVVCCSGEEFGVHFDNILAGDHTNINKHERVFIQHIAETYVYGEIDEKEE